MRFPWIRRRSQQFAFEKRLDVAHTAAAFRRAAEAAKHVTRPVRLRAAGFDASPDVAV